MRTDDPVTTETDLRAAPRGVTITRSTPHGRNRVPVTVVYAGTADGWRWWTVCGLTLHPGDTVDVRTAPADTRFCGFTEDGIYKHDSGGDAA